MNCNINLLEICMVVIFSRVRKYNKVTVWITAELERCSIFGNYQSIVSRTHFIIWVKYFISTWVCIFIGKDKNSIKYADQNDFQNSSVPHFYFLFIISCIQWVLIWNWPKNEPKIPPTLHALAALYRKGLGQPKFLAPHKESIVVLSCLWLIMNIHRRFWKTICYTRWSWVDRIDVCILTIHIKLGI